MSVSDIIDLFRTGQKVSGPVYMSAVPGIDPRAEDKIFVSGGVSGL